MTLLIDDIRPYWETHIPNCRECQFSNGGQFFAAALGSTIQIYNTWTFAIVGTCRGSDSKIKSISWSRDDMKIVSCGIDGSNSTWDARSFKRETLVASEAQFLDSPCFGLDTKQSYSVGADGSIKQIIDGKIVKDVPQNGSLSFIVTANTCDLLFGATKRGFVRTLTYPLLGDSGGTNEFVDYGCHSAPVTRIRVSCDDQFLFSGGEDGLLWVFKIDDKLKRRREKDWIFSDDVS